MKHPVIVFLKKYWLTTWTIVMALSLCSVIIASADYPPALPSMKRVIASTSDFGRKFSSNILIDNGKNTYSPEYKESLLNTSSTYDVEVDIWNYSLKNPLDWYKSTIYYNLSFTFTNIKGEALTAADIGDRTVAVYKDNEELITLSAETLTTDTVSTDAGFTTSLTIQHLTYAAGNSATNSYTLKFKGTWDLEKDEDICVQMIATPNPNAENATSNYNDLAEIGAIIGLKRISGGGESGWTAYMNEHQDSSAAGDPSAYDGYNLVLTGSGAATITVTWDPTKIELNRYFSDSLLRVYSFGTFTDTNENNEVVSTPEVDYDEDTTTLTIHANSGSDVTNHRTRYNIQVYKTGSYELEDWHFFAVKKGNVQDSWYNTADIKVEISENVQ